MKPLTGPEATYMTATAISTASTMTSICRAMPIAVTIEFDREHDIDHDHLPDDQIEGAARRHGLGGFVIALDLGVDLARRLGDQEQAAGDQHDIAPGQIPLAVLEARAR